MSVIDRRLSGLSPFPRSVLTLLSGSAAGQAVPIIIAPVVARLYAPSDFGIFALYLSIVGVLAVISTGRYELAILLPRRSQSADALLALSLALVAITGLATAVALPLLQQQIWISERNAVGQWVFIVPLAILFRGALQSFMFFHTRLENYSRIATAKLTQGATLGIAQVALGFAGFGAGGLILGSIISYIFSAAISAAGVPAKLTLQRSRAALAVKAACYRYRNFPKYNLPHAALRAATSNFPVLLLSVYFSDKDVGLYAMCYGTTVLPLSLVSQSIFQVFSKELAGRWRQDREGARAFARMLLWKISVATILPAIVAVMVAPTLFAVVLGEQWRESGELFRWLSPMIIVSFVSTNFSFIPQLAGKQRGALALELLGFVLMIGTIMIGGRTGNLDLTLLAFSATAALLTSCRLRWYFSLLNDKTGMV